MQSSAVPPPEEERMTTTDDEDQQLAPQIGGGDTSSGGWRGVTLQAPHRYRTCEGPRSSRRGRSRFRGGR